MHTFARSSDAYVPRRKEHTRFMSQICASGACETAFTIACFASHISSQKVSLWVAGVARRRPPVHEVSLRMLD